MIERYRKSIDALASANDLSEIAKFRGLNLEKLKSKKIAHAKAPKTLKVPPKLRLE